MWLPRLQFLLSIIEDLSSLVGMSEWVTLITRHDGGVIQVVQQSAAVSGKDDLLLGPLNGGRKVKVISLLQFLAGLWRISTLLVRVEGEIDGLTIFVNCASATRFCASARTSSCSKVTSFALDGSLYFSF